MNKLFLSKSTTARQASSVLVSACLIFVLFFATLVMPAKATNTYYNFSSGMNLSLNLTPATADLITTNDKWTNIPSVEGYQGTGLTAGFTNVYGIDPQLVTITEFASDGHALPSGNATQIQANKGNPNAVNNGGLAEFDSGPYICFGFQGNVQANPYMVFYINTVGYSNIKMSYRVQDIDGGSNDSRSQIALQYRTSNSGPFINVPDGFIADATDPSSLTTGRITTRNVTLPAGANNQPEVQVRILTTNAAANDGTSTPDEWIGVNSIVLGPFGPTAGGASVGGRIFSPNGTPVANTQVLMYDNTGNARTAISNAFGYYRFENVVVGNTYIFEVRSKRYAFNDAIRVVSVQEDVESLDFYSGSASIINLGTGKESLKF